MARDAAAAVACGAAPDAVPAAFADELAAVSPQVTFQSRSLINAYSVLVVNAIMRRRASYRV